MRLACPHCGPRDLQEFSYRGGVAGDRPEAGAGPEAFAAYVYPRENPAGPLKEHWFHGSGCRRWLVILRDTRSHEILKVALLGAST